MNRNSIPSFARHSLLAVMLASTMLAVTAPAFAAANYSTKQPNHGKLKITQEAEVAGVVLSPGEYEVKAKNTAKGTQIEFVRWTENPYAQEGLPVWDREVIATVDAVPQGATSAAAYTALLLPAGSSGKAVGLQIRGSALQYLFQLAGAEPSVARDSGQ